MKRVPDYVAGGVIAAGGLIGVLLFGRITVYPVAVVSLLPAAAAIVYALLRTVGVRSAPRHMQGPIAVIGCHVVAFIIGLHVLTVCNLAGVAWARALGPRAVVVLLGVAIVAAALAISQTRSKGAQAGFVVAAVTFSLAVGASRIYLGYHWLTDVLSGWLVALAWLSLLLAGLLARRGRGGVLDVR